VVLRATRAIDRAWRIIRAAATVSMIATLVGCAERISFGGSGSTGAAIEPLPAAPTGPAAGAPLVASGGGTRTAPPINMAGRWTLTSPGGGGCAMNFGATPGAAEGTVAPEGGCPGNFFTSRKWVFEDNGLVIHDHTGQPLARLAFGPQGRFDGQATGGAAVTLMR
jgi:protease inhibitor Inh